MTISHFVSALCTMGKRRLMALVRTTLNEKKIGNLGTIVAKMEFIYTVQNTQKLSLKQVGSQIYLRLCFIVLNVIKT